MVLDDGWVLTTDHLVEGIHFDGRLSAADVGFKAMAVNVSDVAAMGARPVWALLNLAVPDDDAWVQGFCAGLGEASRKWGVELIGGDTTRTSGPRFVGLTLAGRARGPYVVRSGGRPGHQVLVTGTPGLAAVGYLHPDPPPDALAALRRPDPQVAFAEHAAAWVSAGMDLSDGLRDDLPRLCAASRTGARIDPSALPDHPALHLGPVPRRTLQLAGGDDYGLLLTAPDENLPRLLELARSHGVTLTRIGALTDGPEVLPTDGPWPAPPWTHFPEGA